MNGLPYYKAYPRDFIEGTIGMPFELKCAYRVVLDLIYMQGGHLPDDARYISGQLGCSIRKWKSLRTALLDAGKIDVSGEFLTNKRAEKELETLAKLQDKQRENRSRPNKTKDLRSPRSDHTEPEPDILSTNVESDAHSSSTKISKPRKRATQLPDGWVPDLGKARRVMEEYSLTRDEMNFCYKKMEAHAHANGRTQKDWDAAYRNWIISEIGYGTIGPNSKQRKSANGQGSIWD